MTITRILPLALVLSLAACGGADDLYLVEPPAPAERVPVRVASIEVRDVVVPAYVSDGALLLEASDGALRPLGSALWADDPVDAITRGVARGLDLGTSATAAAEPWPLFTGPSAEVTITIERLVARAGGQVELEGQYAISFATGARGILRRFAFTETAADTGPAAIADATGRVLARLSLGIATSLAR